MPVVDQDEAISALDRLVVIAQSDTGPTRRMADLWPGGRNAGDCGDGPPCAPPRANGRPDHFATPQRPAVADHRHPSPPLALSMASCGEAGR